MRRHGYASAGLVAAAFAVVAFWAGDLVRFAAPQQQQSSSATAITLAEVDHKFLNDEWASSISSDNFWRNRRSSAPSSAAPSKSRLQGPQPDASWFVAPPSKGSWGSEQGAPRSSSSPRAVSGYRTVCVRLCDGFFFPISFGTSEGNFSRDQSTCSNACPGARLYTYKAGSEEPEDMVDTSGQAYSKLKNANLFRTQFVENCKCKPHPWEQEATERHRIYALEDQRRKGNRAVVAELEDLKAKNRPEAYGSNNSRRRANDRNRRRLPAGEDQTSAAQETVANVSTAPRSDATRGQGGDRIATAALPAAPVSSSVTASTAAPATTGSIETTRSATAVPAQRVLSDASAPSQSPIGRAAETAANSVAAASAATAAGARASTAGTLAAIPVIAVGDAPAPAQVAEPAQVEIPTTVVAAPFNPAAEAATAAKPSRRSRRAERRGGATAAAAARPSGISYLGANARPAPVQVWRPARDAGWASRVFQ